MRGISERSADLKPLARWATSGFRGNRGIKRFGRNVRTIRISVDLLSTASLWKHMRLRRYRTPQGRQEVPSNRKTCTLTHRQQEKTRFRANHSDRSAVLEPSPWEEAQQKLGKQPGISGRPPPQEEEET